MTTARIITFGCKTNQYEGDALAAELESLGVRVDETAEPDVAIVNTCTVTERADRKCRQAAMRVAREHPNARIYITGCYAARARTVLGTLPNVAAVCPGRHELMNAIARRELHTEARPGARVPVTPHSREVRAYLKIQDGCDAFCSYCVVPLVRPTLRSEPLDAILREARAIVDAGFREIVLTGIHLGRYGTDAGVAQPPPAGSLASAQARAAALQDVIREVAATPGLARLRISSLENPEVADEIIDLIATNPIVCPHLHLPLQSGDDGVLAAMNRRYRAADFLATLARVRSRVPDAAITTDVIVGFPGESDAAFENTLRVAREARFSKVHVFPFSARPGTKAARMSKRLPQRVVTRRKKQLLALADELALEFKKRFVGRAVDVLVETAERDASGCAFAVGLTPHYLRARFEGDDSLVGRVVTVRVDAATPELLSGRKAD